jgi:hypothetical protein
MGAVFAEQVAVPLCVEGLEVFIDLRMTHGRAGHVNEQILLGDISHVFRVIIFGEQMIEGLVAARA